LHMVDFHAEGSRRAVLNFNVPDHTESPLEHEAGGSTLHRVWLWLTTGAGLIATAVGIVTIALASDVGRAAPPNRLETEPVLWPSSRVAGERGDGQGWLKL